tara:strand:- start:2140 stop:3030 length:891 start_codon:yes stop_codon:yes gene_type:complete
MPNFNLDNYETVEDRLKLFWKDNPNGRVSTEVVHLTDDGTCITVKAQIFIDKDDTNAVSTGIAQETKGQGGFANKDAWAENCETSAIGRALANWKYQGSNKARPSREEMSKVGSNEDKVQVTKVRTPRTTKAQKEQMNKVVDEMVKEPTNKDVAKQLKTLMSTMVDDEQKLIEYQRDSYVECVSEHGLPEEVEDWSQEQMNTFMNVFEKLSTPNVIDDIASVFEVTEITEGGDDMGEEWKTNPASEGQLKWCKDIVARATDKNLDDLAELKKLWNNGDINGETASSIITNWKDKVK